MNKVVAANIKRIFWGNLTYILKSIEVKMADKSIRLPDNIAGKYYITEDCINCGLCEAIAPDNIKYEEALGAQIVYKQSDSPTEDEQMQEAIESCPTTAIGDDGDI